MHMRLFVVTEEEFEAWVENQKQPASAESQEMAGAELFTLRVAACAMLLPAPTHRASLART